MSAPAVTVCRMDTGVIVYTAELEAPALRETARRFLEAEAARLGASLDPADVLLRRAVDGPEMHIMAAAHELVAHLAATRGRTRSARTARSWSWRVPGRWRC
jgi:hypothetical protein